MHIADLEKNILVANGIVGATMPIGVGAALAAKLRNTDDVAVAFFGDGAANQGADSTRQCIEIEELARESKTSCGERKPRRGFNSPVHRDLGRGFNSPVHRDLGAGEGVKNFLR